MILVNCARESSFFAAPAPAVAIPTIVGRDAAVAVPNDEVFLVALPIAVRCARAANCKVELVSVALTPAGETFANIKTLLSPERQSDNNIVNLDSRYGMCFSPCCNPAKTLLNTVNEPLMLFASCNPEPWTPERETRSDPAKSTRTRREVIVSVWDGLSKTV